MYNQAKQNEAETYTEESVEFSQSKYHWVSVANGVHAVCHLLGHLCSLREKCVWNIL